MKSIISKYSKIQKSKINFNEIKETLIYYRSKTSNIEINDLKNDILNFDISYDKRSNYNFKILHVLIFRNINDEKEIIIHFKLSLFYVVLNFIFLTILCIIPFVTNDFNWFIFLNIYLICILILYSYLKHYMNKEIGFFIKDLTEKHKALYIGKNL